MSDVNSKINRAVWFDISVSDLNRAIEFYRAVLAIEVAKESFGETEFAVFDHQDGNGGCLVVNSDAVGTGGVMLYLNVDGRIREAVSRVVESGGSVIQDVHAIGPHGFRAIIQDCEGNELALLCIPIRTSSACKSLKLDR